MAANIAEMDSTCGRDTIQSSKSQPNGQQTSTAETTNSSPNKNASQEDSSDTPPVRTCCKTEHSWETLFNKRLYYPSQLTFFPKSKVFILFRLFELSELQRHKFWSYPLRVFLVLLFTLTDLFFGMEMLCYAYVTWLASGTPINPVVYHELEWVSRIEHNIN